MTRANAGGIIDLHYEGEFQMDQPHGFGRQTEAKGTYFEGFFTKGLKGPSGTYRFGDGIVYQGEFLNDKLHGKGKMIQPQKMVYEGDWNNNEMHGEGLYIWEDGRRY